MLTSDHHCTKFQSVWLKNFDQKNCQREQYIINGFLQNKTAISSHNYLFTAITRQCRNNGGGFLNSPFLSGLVRISEEGARCPIINKFRTFFERNFDQRNTIHGFKVETFKIYGAFVRGFAKLETGTHMEQNKDYPKKKNHKFR